MRRTKKKQNPLGNNNFDTKTSLLFTHQIRKKRLSLPKHKIDIIFLF